MKLRLLLAILVILVGFGLCKEAARTHYIPVSCIGRFIVKDWGPCTHDGQVWTCPKASIQFTEGCSSVKPTGPQEQKMNINYPTAVQEQ